MIYKQLALTQAITELGSIQLMLDNIKDEPLIIQALEDIKKATEKLVEIEKGVSDYLEERR